MNPRASLKKDLKMIIGNAFLMAGITHFRRQIGEEHILRRTYSKGGNVAQTKLQAIGLRHEYYQPRTGGRLLALDNINLQVDDGEFVTIVGPSGCGKTTFINLCDGLLKPTAGKIMIDGKQIGRASCRERV